MQVIAPRIVDRPRRATLVTGTIVGSVLLFGGLAVAWLAFGTSFISSFTPTGRPEPSQMLAGMLAWTFALIAPATFIIVGLARIVAVVDSVAAQRPRASMISRLGAVLGDDYVVTTRLRLPDGRVVPELVIGPFGAAVLEPLPPAGATRRHGTAWEVRRTDGRWVPLENPLDRASRDAEAVKRWFAHDDHDFIVKSYAAVVGPEGALPRTPTCAMISTDQIPAWILSLPPQRSLTPARREQIIELVREAA
jgi:hypothetical protein